MKNIYKNIVVLAMLCTISYSSFAQRSFIGASFGFNSYKTNFTQDKFAVTSLAPSLHYMRYSSVRRGYSINASPLYLGNIKTTDHITSKTTTDKLSGMGLGVSVFGLIGTDYQSKLEFGLINTLGVNIYKNSFLGAINLDLGLMARYRLNSKMKIQFQTNPITLWDLSNAVVNMNASLGFYFAP